MLFRPPLFCSAGAPGLREPLGELSQRSRLPSDGSYENLVLSQPAAVQEQVSHSECVSAGTGTAP